MSLLSPVLSMLIAGAAAATAVMFAQQMRDGPDEVRGISFALGVGYAWLAASAALAYLERAHDLPALRVGVDQTFLAGAMALLAGSTRFKRFMG